MMNTVSIQFSYQSRLYHALVRIKKGVNKEYYVTIMNGELEALLYGNHIFVEKNEQIEKDLKSNKVSQEIIDLRESIIEAIGPESNSALAVLNF